MIAKDSGTGKSFSGLTNYLENGHKGEKKDRVDWFAAENMDIGSLREGAMLMKEAANENSRVEKPVYHFSINWHPDESGQVDKELGIKIAREALKDLGLEDHHALIVAHKDTDHYHVHIVANRIHPETDKAWTGSFTKMKLEESMARLSLEHGFEVVPGRHNSKDLGIEPPQADVSQPSEALRYEQRTDSPSYNTKVKIELPEVFEKSNSWEELHSNLDEKGYQIQTRGRGLVVVDQEGHFAKVSSIGREFSKASLERRFEEKFAAKGQKAERLEVSQKQGSGREIERASGQGSTPEEKAAQVLDRSVHKLEEINTKTDYVRALFVERQEVLSRTEDSYKKHLAMKDAKTNLERSFNKIFSDPEAAMKAFNKDHYRKGIDAAAKELFEKPQSFGKLKHGRGARFMSGLLENEFLKDLSQLKSSFEPYRASVEEVNKDREGYKADLSERFDKSLTTEIKKIRDELKAVNRAKIERDILEAAGKLKANDIRKAPFGSRLRAEVVDRTVKDLRGKDQDRKWARSQGETVDRSYKRFPSIPLNLSDPDRKAWLAVDAYAKARHEIDQAATWMGENSKKAPELFKRLRESADAVIEQGKRAERHFSRFKIDKQVLYASSVSGERGTTGKSKITPFVRSKSPSIQIKLSSVLRLVGIPVPRLPRPRIPVPRVPLSKGIGRELKR